MATLVVTTEKSGVDRYSRELAERLDIKTIETRRYLRVKESYRLASQIRNEPDIIHITNQNFARYALFRSRPFIVTVHDLIRFYIRFIPEKNLEKLFLKLDIFGLKHAAHIIAVSQHTKKDIMKYLMIPEDRITVIYNGINHFTYKPYQQRMLDEPFIIYVGSERPRKNLNRLLEAFAIVKKDFPKLRLIKIGESGRSSTFHSNTIEKLHRLGIEDSVLFVEYVSDTYLAHYYSCAEMLVYPSLYEGFGLPPLEAMACGCPVVASNTSSLPEVVGDAGILVNPYDMIELAQAMKRVLSDKYLRDEMKNKGLQRAGRFCWNRAAEQTMAVYQKVADG